MVAPTGEAVEIFVTLGVVCGVMRPSLESLSQECLEAGVRVSWAVLPSGYRGLYLPDARTVYLRAGMPDWVAVPTLMHELCHVERGDTGHQEWWVEARIDRSVARRLVDVRAYAAAEALVGPGAGALAAELEVPVWVVEAYRDTLRTHRRAVHSRQSPRGSVRPTPTHPHLR